VPLSCTVNGAGLEQEDEHQPGDGSMNTRDVSFPSAQSSRHYDDSFEGPRNFMSSGTHSARSFGSRSVGTVSPGAFVMKVGSWADGYLPEADDGDRRLPPEYYFVETPLRLSPQDEHCQGRPESPW